MAQIRHSLVIQPYGIFILQGTVIKRLLYIRNKFLISKLHMQTRAITIKASM